MSWPEGVSGAAVALPRTGRPLQPRLGGEPRPHLRTQLPDTLHNYPTATLNQQTTETSTRRLSGSLARPGLAGLWARYCDASVRPAGCEGTAASSREAGPGLQWRGSVFVTLTSLSTFYLWHCWLEHRSIARLAVRRSYHKVTVQWNYYHYIFIGIMQGVQ